MASLDRASARTLSAPGMWDTINLMSNEAQCICIFLVMAAKVMSLVLPELRTYTTARLCHAMLVEEFLQYVPMI